MRREKKPENTVGISLELPRDFSLKIARHILDLSEHGVKTTKADLLLKYAQIGLNEEINKDSK
jgi:hypothetical protein